MDAAYTLDPGSGLLTGARYHASPHCDARPAHCTPDLLVIHSISLPAGEYGGDAVPALFLGTLDTTSDARYAALHGLRVSAHLWVRRDGKLLQFVPLQRRAWHAGVSAWRGRERCNDYSIGIELEGLETAPFAPAQYRTLAALTRCLRRHYPAITAERIAAHSEIAPGRKADPGPHFDWAAYRAAICR